MDVIKQRIERLHLKRKVRSDAVYIVSFVLGASPEFFKVSTREKQYAFFRDCVKFFQDKYGEENVLSAIVHMDETNPHLHLNLIPITHGKLCAKDLFDGKLVALQTEFWKEVGERYGLDRGKPNSQTEHLDTAEYKAKKLWKLPSKNAPKQKNIRKRYSKPSKAKLPTAKAECDNKS
jgi:hypothetical protein